jgi:hypothetical protein
MYVWDKPTGQMGLSEPLVVFSRYRIGFALNPYGGRERSQGESSNEGILVMPHHQGFLRTIEQLRETVQGAENIRHLHRLLRVVEQKTLR